MKRLRRVKFCPPFEKLSTGPAESFFHSRTMMLRLCCLATCVLAFTGEGRQAERARFMQQKHDCKEQRKTEALVALCQLREGALPTGLAQKIRHHEDR